MSVASPPPSETTGAVVDFRQQGKSSVFRAGAVLFSDRKFTVKTCPKVLDGMSFFQGPIDLSAFIVKSPGKLLALTPQSVELASSQIDSLEAAGFSRVGKEPFQLFGNEPFNRVWIYEKQVQTGERYRFGKFAVFLGFKSAGKWEKAPADWRENDGELLYNGIRLPKEWPPQDVETQDKAPMDVPYLRQRPDVVPVNVGRQLFVDDFLIESTSLARTFHHPKKYEANPVLKPQTDLEMGTARVSPLFRGKPGAPFAAPKSGGVWWDPQENVFKMWYEAGWLNTVALATSRDGIHWERGQYDVRPGTNQVLPVDLTPDSWTVVPNYDAKDPDEKYTLFICAPGPDQHATSLTSPDGIHWVKRAQAGITGDRSTHFYNPFRKQWVYSLRTGFSDRGRARHYYETPDFLGGAAWTAKDKTPWLMTDEKDPTDYLTGERPQLYNFDAAPYESIMLGVFEVHQGPPNEVCEPAGLPKITELQFAYSRDGFHWDRPDRTIAIPAERTDKWDRGYVQSVGGICVIMGDELWFYYSGLRGDPARARVNWMQGGGMYSDGATGLAKLRRDGFASMDANAAPGELLTRPIVFTGGHLFVNVNAPQGALRAQIETVDGQPIAPFTFGNCVPTGGDHTLAPVRWSSGSLSSLAGTPVRIRFALEKGSLYAFWVSKDQSGRSDGYLAGGGPGYSGPTDTVGSAARQAVAP